MNTATAVKKLRVVLDTNIFISAVIFAGKPGTIFQKVLSKEVQALTSEVLLAELADVLVKKFGFYDQKIDKSLNLIRKNAVVLNPREQIAVLEDQDDNRVLEAAVEGKVDFIVTGDKGLLELKEFRGIKIVTPDEFLKLYP
ncbi:MAG TPA: putative toxin-antitoxin system toxin component, PIN family [Candidatus Nanoarchaeia archaeon]